MAKSIELIAAGAGDVRPAPVMNPLILAKRNTKAIVRETNDTLQKCGREAKSNYDQDGSKLELFNTVYGQTI